MSSHSEADRLSAIQNPSIHKTPRPRLKDIKNMFVGIQTPHICHEPTLGGDRIVGVCAFTPLESLSKMTKYIAARIAISTYIIIREWWRKYSFFRQLTIILCQWHDLASVWTERREIRVMTILRASWNWYYYWTEFELGSLMFLSSLITVWPPCLTDQIYYSNRQAMK